jgi:hypothetical protein
MKMKALKAANHRSNNPTNELGANLTLNGDIEILREIRADQKKIMQGENSQYQAVYYYSHAIAALIINIGHLFFGPFALPLLYCIYGKNLMHAMLLDLNKFYIIGDFTSWLWFAGTILMMYMHPELNGQLSILYIGTGSVILLRQILVSLKYGYFTKKNWELMCNTKVSYEFILNHLILRAWIRVPQDICEHEITGSIHKLKIKPNYLNLKFKELPEFIDEDLDYVENFDFPNAVPLTKIAQYLVKRVTENQDTFELTLINMYGYVYIGSYFALRYYGYGWKGFRLDPVEIIYTVHSLFKGYISSVQFVKFIAAGLYDYNRKKILMAQCTGLISKVDKKLLLFGKKGPELDLDDPMTILSWYYLRRIFIDFGRRYTLRVFLYASLILPVGIIVVFILFLQLVGIVGTSYNYYITPGFLLSIEVFALLMHMSASALSVNNYFEMHKDILLERCGALKGQGDSQEIINYLEYVIKRIEHDQELRPLKIMGILIDNSFILQIGALGLSGLYALISLLAKK